MYKRYLATAATLLYVISAQAQAGLGAYPMKVWFNGGPGQVQTQVVHLVNTSTDTLDIGVFFRDWHYDSLGNTLFFAAGSTPISCSGWIKLSADTRLKMAPGEDKAIPVTMEAPSKGSGTIPVHTAVLVFQQLNALHTRDNKGMSIKVALQIGIKLYHSMPDSPEAAVEIKSFRETGTPALQMTLANTGDRLVDGSVTCTLTNKEDGKAHHLDKVPFYTLPGDTRIVSFTIPADLPVGHYLVTGLVDSDALDEVQAAELEVTWDEPHTSY